MGKLKIINTLVLLLTVLIFSNSFADETAKELLKKGINFGNNDQVDMAIAQFTKAIEINPKFANAYFNRGKAYAIKGSYDKAILDYTKAIEFNPGYASAYNKRCNANIQIGNNDQAISDCTKAIKLNPRLAYFSYNNRGHAYQNKGNFDQAILDFTLAIKARPFLSESYINRAIAYFAQKNYDKGKADMRQAGLIKSNITPNDPTGPHKVAGK